MAYKTLVLSGLMLALVAAPACVVKRYDDLPAEEGGGDQGGGDEGGGNEGGDDGSIEIPAGPPGSVGNACDEGSCDADLVCSLSDVCQPSLSELPPNVVQAVPTPDSAAIPSSAPIMLFLDGMYADVQLGVMAHSIDAVTDISDDVVVTKLTSGADKDVIVLSAKSGFPLGASIVVAISGDMVGTLVFNVSHAAPAYADDLGFEGPAGEKNSCEAAQEGFAALPKGWTGFGDVGVVPAVGSLTPSDGDSLVAMTTGDGVCGSALAGTSSMLVSGPILHEGDSATVSFDYNFQSSEFDDYCDSAYDDTLLAVLSGPKGAVAEVIDSVNIVCATGEQGEASFPGQPDGGDADFKETGVKQHSLSGEVGSPAVLTIVVTDVGDAILSTVVGLDKIVVE